MSNRPAAPKDDTGLTLVELIVAIVVASLVLSVITATFINGWKAQESATVRDKATGAANVAATTLRGSIRNAEDFRVSEDGSRLDAVVAQPGASTGDAAWDWKWECRAWKVADDRLYYSAGTAPRPSDIVTGRAPLVETAVGTLGEHRAFETSPGTLDEQRRVRIGLKISTGPEDVILDDAVTAQVIVQGGAPACW